MFENRKRLLLDRGPSWPDFNKAEPFMIRYYLLFRKRPKWFPFNIFLHKILKSDLGDLHDHYWSYFTIILKGGYWETTKKGRFWRSPGYMGLRKASDTHSLTIPEGKTAWTLIFVGPNKGSKQFANFNKKNQNARKH
tara:strand:- start:203 stop:613 length:411 start_codon:yes stop_codon:yes gene_type:complete